MEIISSNTTVMSLPSLRSRQMRSAEMYVQMTAFVGRTAQAHAASMYAVCIRDLESRQNKTRIAVNSTNNNTF